MKKNIKHTFRHQDPEEIKTDKKEDKKPEKKSAAANEIKDLKKSLFLITLFVVLIFGLYLVQTKTALLNSALKLFGL
jgi:uncharacterized membrane protein